MAYGTTYDGGFSRSMSRSMSRRPSMGYAVSAPAAYTHGGSYMEHGMHGDYPAPSYPVYAPQPSNAIVPLSRRLTGTPYDDVEDYPETPYYEDGYSRPVTPHHMGSQYTHGAPGHMPGTMAVVTIPPPMQQRRHSVSFVAPSHRDSHHHDSRHHDYRSSSRYPGRPSSMHVKFKRKGSFSGGIGLDEASHVRLSNNDGYSMHSLHADSRNRILLKVSWVGYMSMTYEIPLDGYDGRIDLATLARRVARACIHYLEAHAIPILWERVILHHLEEVSYGTWQPMLSTR